MHFLLKSFSNVFWLAMAMILIIPMASAQQKTTSFFVSKKGSDKQEGRTKDKPFASAEYALEQIRKYKSSHPDHLVEMLINDGQYYLS